MEMLIFADDLEALGADVDGLRGIVCAYVLLSCFGFPFKWSKQRVGMKVKWIGLYADYTLRDPEGDTVMSTGSWSSSEDTSAEASGTDAEAGSGALPGSILFIQNEVGELQLRWRAPRMIWRCGEAS